jgi:hypothetical protein
MQQKYLDRYEELNSAFAYQIFVLNTDKNSISPNGAWHQWATSAQLLIESTYGQRSPQARNFETNYKSCVGYEGQVRGLFSIFQSARDDFCKGFSGDAELRISGEVFGDFVALAKQSLSESHKDVAAVLASAALEDVLKKFAAVNGLETDQKTMTEIVNSLKGAGLVAGAQKSILESMVRIRNSALHADWAKISEAEVGGVIGFVEQFLLEKFA